MADKAKRTYKPWTQKEIEDLMQIYSNSAVSIEKLVTYFGRSWDAIEGKARKLGLHRPNFQKPWTSAEEAYLIESFPNTDISSSEMKVCFGRSWKAIHYKAKSLGLERLNPSYQHWRPEEIEELKQAYANPEISPECLVANFGRSWRAIHHKAKSLGLERPNPSHRHWTPEENEGLVQVYPNPKISREQMTAYFGRTWDSIQSQAKNLGLCRRHPYTIHVVRDYFRVIDSDEKSYWLGFLAADGSVQCRAGKHQVTLGLQQRDLHWLERYRDTIAPEAAITKHGGSYVVSISCKEMVEDVIAYGIGPNKAKTLTFPTITDDFAMAFILGFFDGDGCLHKYRLVNTCGWSLLGTLPFLTIARNYIMHYAQVEINEPVRHNKIRCPHLYQIRAYGQRAIAIDRTLNASGLGLPRKHLP